MKLINEKYKKLGPTIEFLGDEVIIAQAWKKTHAYMRLRNWYADTLALDISALNLEALASLWAKQVQDLDPIILEPMELVPATKSEPWIIDSKRGWIPDNREQLQRKEKPPIRPLAHLTVRDQTLASAVMLCIADAVESRQGDCTCRSDTDFFLHQKKGVYSYGNRLICDWDKDSAWFRWGNAESYRKFFTDYQSFLKRPIMIGRFISGGQGDAERVYVVSLDISRFYDCVNRALLHERLQKLFPSKSTSEQKRFWDKVKEIINWKWDDNAYATASNIGIKIGEGLPQGLVSAGFFANAYLLDFDQEVGNVIGNSFGKTVTFTVNDYCRYVDDLRLVVTVDDTVTLSDLQGEILVWLNSILKNRGSESLELNDNKIKIMALEDLNNRGVFSERVAQLQSQISGPTDRDLLESAQGVLEGFLVIDSGNIPEPAKENPDAALLRIARFDHDIRVDTLKRFAANRLERVIRNKRQFDVGIEDGNVLEETIDNESELLAKKLIWAWMQDPSLGLVLRKAFEIFPSPDIAEPVLEALYRRCSFSSADNKDTVTAAMADYLMADIFRSSVDFQAIFQRFNYPASSNPDGFLSLVCRYAQKAVSKENLPNYIARQAFLFLAVMGKPVRIDAVHDSIQHSLHAVLAGIPIKLIRQRLALYEVAAQITGDGNTVANQLIDAMDDLDPEAREKILDDYAKRGGDFWASMWQRLKRNNQYADILSKYRWAAPQLGGSPSNSMQFLSKIVSSNKNGFEHEAGFLKLGIGLLKLLESHEKFEVCSPRTIKVKQMIAQGKAISWAEIWKPVVIGIECSFVDKDSTEDPRFAIPKWVQKTRDARIIYKFGAILRATVVGASDFTANRWRKNKIISYKGLQTSWFKRRMGMMHSPEALVGDFSTLSEWVSELLMTCLQWPGFEANYISNERIANISSVDELKELLESRLNEVNGFYCSASELPALITKVRRPYANNVRGFRIVTVQQLLPRTSDFSSADPELNARIHRGINRDHVSRICTLTHQILNATVTAHHETAVSSADLIVFPEVGIHPDDFDVVKRLAGKTGAIILAGMVFTDVNGKRVNIARWVIPNYRDSGRYWIIRDQGKKYPTQIEQNLGVSGYRPCQHIIEIHGFEEGPFYLSGSICYDATDLKLASDLKNKTDLFVILAHNKDVSTFDTMASALHYHMYQHVALVNKGEFGGSTIQAPYREQYHRLISHAHGSNQISINVADLDLAAFKRKAPRDYRKTKTKPAG